MTHQYIILAIYWNKYTAIVLLKQRSGYNGMCDSHDFVSEQKIQ